MPGLEEAADFGEEVGNLIAAANALHGLARLGQARKVADRLADVAARVDGEFVVARAAYANAVAARDRHALHAVSETFAALGANLYEAEASVEAAAVSRRSGHPRDAAAHEHRAAQLLSRCEGATTRSSRRSRPGPGSPPASSTPPYRPPPAVPTSKSPLTVTSR